MVNSCCAIGCTNRFFKGTKIGFYRFPRNPKRRQRWIQALKREGYTPTEDHRVCGKHFQTGKRSSDPSHPDYIPNVFSFKPPDSSAEKFEERKQRSERRWAVKSTPVSSTKCGSADTSCLEPSADCQPHAPHLESGSCHMNNDSEIADLSGNENDELLKLKEELGFSKIHVSNLMVERDDLEEKLQQASATVQHLSREKAVLEKRLCEAYDEINALRSERNLSQQKLVDADSTQRILQNPSMLLFYTGLVSVKQFYWMLSILSAFENTVQSVPLSTQLLMVLMKLKLNILFTDLAYRFFTSRKTVYRIFDNIIPVLAANLNALIIWPDTRALKKNIPSCFKNSLYKDTTVIIDCTEVRIQRPSNMLTKSQTWSTYKQSHTIKFLVGMSPAGAVIYLSGCWGGRASDKEITLNSEIMTKIKPGDIILVDRGFILETHFAALGARLIVPDFLREKKQLTRQQVIRSKKISNVCIHVERVIRQIKRFQILQTTIPIKLLKHIDSVVIICASLSNISRLVVK